VVCWTAAQEDSASWWRKKLGSFEAVCPQLKPCRRAILDALCCNAKGKRPNAQLERDIFQQLHKAQHRPGELPLSRHCGKGQD
jgi:hypothetical protein